MAVLCDTQIRECVPIEPFAENVKRPGTVSYGVSSYGYDVRVGTKFKIFTNATSGGVAIVDPKNFTNDLFITIDTAQTGKDHILIPPNSFALAETIEVFDVREPPATPAPTAPNNAGNRLIFTRARGAGIYALNLLSQIETIRPMLAGIPVSLLRPESSLSNYPAANITSGGILYTPSSRSTAGTGSTRSELLDTWGGRVAFVFPGRAFRYGVDTGLPDADGTVRTPAENILGVCTNRRICLVSAGPDGLFGVSGEVTPDTAIVRAAAAADNIYLYELDPPD